MAATVFTDILSSSDSIKLFGNDVTGLTIDPPPSPNTELALIHGFAMNECCYRLKRPVLYLLPVKGGQNDDSCRKFTKEKFKMWIVKREAELTRIEIKSGKAKDLLHCESLGDSCSCSCSSSCSCSHSCSCSCSRCC
jgi:hypothetical protein